MISVSNLNKVYADGFQALTNVSLEIPQGEIFALLGPNGAGKTTLISILCGLTNLSSGDVRVGGHDVLAEFRKTRGLIGLVPQELSVNAFETVWDAVTFSRGLFGKKPNPDLLETLLKRLSLWDKKKNPLMALSGGMKRRLMIAKALSHEPRVLFLDEPTAGVDVELRKDMWQQVRELKNLGVTIILTTHYIEEAEEMADRIGVINKGQLILVEEKDKLMKKMAVKEVTIELPQPISKLPETFNKFKPQMRDQKITFSYDLKNPERNIQKLLESLHEHDMQLVDIESKKTSLEEIFVGLVGGTP